MLDGQDVYIGWESRGRMAAGKMVTKGTSIQTQDGRVVHTLKQH